MKADSRIQRLRLALQGSAVRRGLALVLLAVGTALLVIEPVRLPSHDFQVGEVADRDVRATTTFQFVDWDATQARQRTAEAAVSPVFDFDATLAARLQARVGAAFENARRRHGEAVAEARSGGGQLGDADTWEIAASFLKQVELSLDPVDLEDLVAMRFSVGTQELALSLIGDALRRTIVAERSLLPTPERPLAVVRILADTRDEIALQTYADILVPEEARRDISLRTLEHPSADLRPAEVRAAVAVARAAVRPNFSYNQLLTEERRQRARAAVGEVVVDVQRGTTLAREGDVLSRQQVDLLAALRASKAGSGVFGAWLSLTVLCGMFFVGVYQFGAGFLPRFSTRDRDVEATAITALLVVGAARLVVELGDVLANAVGMGASPTSFWYLAPVAGGAMLVRVLVNAETALLFVISAAAIVGIVMDQQVLYALFFVLSGLVGASAVAGVHERARVLRAGVLTGLVNAALALLINLVSVHLGEASATPGSAVVPLWDVGFAFLGGLGSAVLVLGLLPVFEMVGFVTDFRLLELANLNHPLLRQLMLRAPGTYHHSIIVGSLSEAAADAIGGNALQARVACYFHDIGKAVKPHHFIENVRDRPNPHDRLQPAQSARIIVNHVLDGEAIARQYNLPSVIVDGIRMHHGTSLIKYFYARALTEAGPDGQVDADLYRYPGPRPNTRETGIIFLADRVEAACRTLKDPSAESIRQLIQAMVNDAVADGQLEECPLTLQELYTIIESMVQTLLGIYHHRIEYPGLPRARQRAGNDSQKSVITLELEGVLDQPIDDDPASVPPSLPPVAPRPLPVDPES
jgi:cyclic-di-AMP phosphodiesterase PgpH